MTACRLDSERAGSRSLGEEASMTANSNKSKQGNKAAHRVIAGVLCGASVLSLVLSLVMPPISQAIANDAQPVSTEKTVMGGGSSSESTDVDNTTNGDTENQNSDETEGDETGDDALEAVPLSDDAEAEGAAQPADDGEPVYKVATIANESEAHRLQQDADGYTLLNSDDDLSTYLDMENKPGKLRLAADISSSTSITISQNTTIDLARHKLYYSNGNNDINDKNCSFITISTGATLTVEGAANDGRVEAPSGTPGQIAKMQWNDSTPHIPQSLTYYVTESTPNELGTSETTYQHTVTDFGAIVACKEGYVNQVISVEDGGTLNLNGGMITTPRTLGNDGHVIFSKGTVNISGGYVTNGSGGGWGGGLCMATGSLNMTGGVIAANMAAAGGGIFADSGVTLNLSGGVISGNATYANRIDKCGEDTGSGGYGGGVYTKGAYVTIGGSANITNNRVDAYVADSNEYNYGLLGGGGIACTHGGTLTMTGGSVTANYSYEAGGGVYAGYHGKGITFGMTGGFISGNMSDNAEGGGLRISEGTTGVIEAASASNKVYITNNKTMTGSTDGRKGDWGGGGVFVQTAGTLNLRAALVTKNDAGGWGGGIGACPTGQTIVTHTNGSAIYANTDHGEHSSAGGNGKNEDSQSKYITDIFKKEGHADFFLVRSDNSQQTVAAVLGKMLGGGSAGWKGTCDGNKITIDPNGGAEAKYMFGLEAHPTKDAIEKAQEAATTIISGNYSYTHGGGIMTNGDLVVGEVSDLRVYPSMKLKATKALVNAKGDKQPLNGHEYKFQLLRQEVNGTKAPSWKDDGTLDMGECSGAGEATVDQLNGSITFDSGKDYSSGQYVFYLVEEPISGENELDTKFDKTIYKIVVKVGDKPTETKYLMSYPINYYKVEGVTVYKKSEGAQDFEQLNRGYSVEYLSDNTMASVNIGDGDNPTFINKIEPYDSLGSWTPAATKVVEGGEMKEFTLEFADNESFTGDSVKTVSTAAGGDKSQTLNFDSIEYKLDQLDYLTTDPTGRGASKTFTYYVCEQQPTTPFTNYKYDESVYRFDVTMTDQKDGTIKATTVTYTKIKGVDGEPVKDTPHELTDTSTPTFTNTYSTSLPLSGMSGVTLTYLAGAAVLCAAAAWMHIRRKANAKGGERRE